MTPKLNPWMEALRRWGPAAGYVAGGFAAATALALVEHRTEPEIVLPTRAAEAARAQPAKDESPSVAAPLVLARAPIAVDPAADLFPPPPAPPPPPIPQAPAATARPKPQAPPFAYSYVGRMEEDGVTRLLLARGDALVIVRAGESIEGGFRLDRIDDDSITVTHPATRTKRKLSLDALAAQQPARAPSAPVYGVPNAMPGYGYVPQPPPVDPPEPVAPVPEASPPPAPAFVPPGAMPQPQSAAPMGGDPAAGPGGAPTIGGVTIGGGGETAGMAPQPVVPLYGQQSR